MAKISLVSAKYIIHAKIEIRGAVDRPDVIGAIFGQTEGLLGSDLELRELQKSGRIGRIEVKVETQGGMTKGEIIIPSSLDKAETSIVGAALEVIQRIGPCDSKIWVEKIEDVRISKRGFVIDRAKQLLKHLTEEVLPDSQDLADEVAHSIRVMEIQNYGKERLPAGPSIDESEDIIVVEGRADVLNLLKHGIKNAIAMNGTSVPQTVRELSRRKVVNAFVDGDRGGDLIIKELESVADLDFITKAPDGKEVEELTKKEIFNSLRGRKAVEKKIEATKPKTVSPTRSSAPQRTQPVQRQATTKPAAQPAVKPVTKPALKPTPKAPIHSGIRRPLSTPEKTKFKDLLEDLIGTRAAVALDEKLNALGKVPLTELSSTIKNVDNVYAVVFDGDVDQTILDAAEKSGLNCVVGMGKKIKSIPKIHVLTVDDL